MPVVAHAILCFTQSCLNSSKLLLAYISRTYNAVATACNNNADVPYYWPLNVRCALTAVLLLCCHGVPNKAWTAAGVVGKGSWLGSATPFPWTLVPLPPVRSILIAIYVEMVLQGECIEWLVLRYAVFHPAGPASYMTRAVASVPCMHCLHDVVKGTQYRCCCGRGWAPWSACCNIHVIMAYLLRKTAIGVAGLKTGVKQVESRRRTMLAVSGIHSSESQPQIKSSLVSSHSYVHHGF